MKILLPILAVTLLFPPLATAQLPPPSTVLERDGMRVPVYEGFDSLAPLFESVHSDDTLLIINFWATWCAPCVKELPYFEELDHANSGRPIRVLLVNLDFRKQLEKRLIPFLKERNLASETVVLDDPDANAWIDSVSDEWSGAIPATLFVLGEKRMFREQSFNRNELNTLVESFQGLHK